MSPFPPSFPSSHAESGRAFASTAGSKFDRASGRQAVSAGPPRTAMIVTGDGPLCSSLAETLGGLRWKIQTAATAAEMFCRIDARVPAVCFLDSWLPDLQVRDCVRELGKEHPEVDVFALDGSDLGATAASGPFRAEALHALREAQARLDAPAWKRSLTAGEILRRYEEPAQPREGDRTASERAASTGFLQRATSSASASVAAELARTQEQTNGLSQMTKMGPVPETAPFSRQRWAAGQETALPEFLGNDGRMLEVSRRIRLVAHRKTAVLVHGPSGTGKELVARALHRLSGRAAGPWVAINCAAIPEALMEAELFGHARGAFTGATHSRVGRIEAAAGGTLFLDEIGELPLAVQGKLLRFLESGELQRVGENETVRVDTRLVAATHRKLGAMAAEGTFRLDLLHRLSVFLIQTPALAGRDEDIDTLVDAELARLGAEESPKCLSDAAREKLHAYPWPGNVRELQHTVERAWILSGDSAVVDEECVDFGEALS